jgi:hypothetical protein
MLGAKDSVGQIDWANSPNAHLKDYLDYYQKLENPRFAVLITGAWGTGKTHLVKSILNWEGEKPKAIYISLFGKNSSEEIVAAVYAEMHPTLSKAQKVTEGVGEAARGTTLYGFPIGGLGAGAAKLFSAFMQKDVDQSKIIIFDDLERSDISPKEVLGVINHYVEHYKCRVVVIAHDEKFIEGVKETKEKIFGQTIQIEPDFESAFALFLAEIADPNARKFLASNLEIFETIFRLSGVESLRILRQVLLDSARLYLSLEQEQRDNEQATKKVIELFAAFNFEVRADRLEQSNFSSDGHQAYLKIEKQYPHIKRFIHLLPLKILHQTLINGRYEKIAIIESLNDTPDFTPKEKIAPWQTVIQFDSLDDKIVEAATAEMIGQFDKRLVTESGEMLHTFALRMLMASLGILDKSILEIENECKKYIDDLMDTNRLSPRLAGNEFDRSSRFNSAHGIGFWVSDYYKDAFYRVAFHLHEKSQEALEKTYPNAAKEILKHLLNDSTKFIGAISQSGIGDHKFAMLPVLKEIEPKAFVEAWLKSTKEKDAWYFIRIALENRYSGHALSKTISEYSGYLNSEMDWIQGVVEEMKKIANSEKGFTKLRIERAIPRVAVLNEGSDPNYTSPLDP